MTYHQYATGIMAHSSVMIICVAGSWGAPASRMADGGRVPRKSDALAHALGSLGLWVGICMLLAKQIKHRQKAPKQSTGSHVLLWIRLTSIIASHTGQLHQVLKHFVETRPSSSREGKRQLARDENSWQVPVPVCYRLCLPCVTFIASLAWFAKIALGCRTTY